MQLFIRISTKKKRKDYFGDAFLFDTHSCQVTIILRRGKPHQMDEKSNMYREPRIRPREKDKIDKFVNCNGVTGYLLLKSEMKNFSVLQK